MEDLRKDYNVAKKKNDINISLWWKSNKAIITNILILSSIIIFIFFPHIIGGYIGYWFNLLYQSFVSNVDISKESWIYILGTGLVLSIIYRIIR
jgi:hypothetical protein